VALGHLACLDLVNRKFTPLDQALRSTNNSSRYYAAIWFLLIGAVSPIPFYFLARKYPRSLFRYVNIPVVWVGPTGAPPATGINFSSWLLVGFIFQYYLRRFRFMWSSLNAWVSRLRQRRGSAGSSPFMSNGRRYHHWPPHPTVPAAAAGEEEEEVP